MLRLLEELLVEILKRLPVKSLYRCMSVCRLWYSLITTSYFISTHLNHHKALSRRNFLQKTGPVYCTWEEGSRDVSKKWYLKFYTFSDDGFILKELHEFDFPEHSLTRLVGCCDGMMCIESFNCHMQPHVTILNPSQKKSLVLNLPYHRHPFFIGFGFDSSSNDYKLVSVSEDENLSLRVYVYSLRERTWKPVATTFLLPAESPWISHEGEHVEGLLYWPSSESIVTFNLAREEFGEISLPEAMLRQYTLCLVSPFPIFRHGKDFVGICCSDRARSYLWIMEEYGNPKSWREFLVMNFDDFQRVHHDRVNDEVVFEIGEQVLITFNPVRRGMGYPRRHYYLYLENLISLDLQPDSSERRRII